MGRKAISTSNLRQKQDREDNRRLSDRHNGHKQHSGGGGGGGRTNAQSRASFKGKSESFFKSLDARDLIKEKENENKEQRMVIEIKQDKNRATAAAAADEEMDDEGEVIRVGDHKSNKQGPAVYVTGLSTVKLRGDKIQFTKTFKKTIHNENAVLEIDKRVASKPIMESKVSFPPQPIRIKIDNEKALADRIARPQQIKYRDSDVADMDMDEEPVSGSGIQSTVTVVKKQPVLSSQIYDPHGYRLQISNLHPKVTEDDIRELFGDIGPVKRARFLDKGVAEVVYVRLDDAKQAIAKYHRNELDGRAMIIELLDKPRQSSNYATESPSNRHDFKKTIYSNGDNHASNSRVTSTVSPSKSRTDYHHQQESSASSSLVGSTLSDKFKNLTKEKFVLPESVALMSNKNPNNKVDRIDPSLVTQTLFNTKPASSTTTPVTFTVKI